VTKQKVAREESVAKHDGNNRAPHHGSIKFNGTVHRAAANDMDFMNRSARGSVCNGLLFGGIHESLLNS